MKKYLPFFLMHSLWLLGVCAVANCFLATPIGSVTSTVHEADSLSIQFETFSPAYSAFEDEYLFENEVTESEALLAGTSNDFYLENSVNKVIMTPQLIHPMAFVIHNESYSSSNFYDDETKNIKGTRTPFAAPSQPIKVKASKKLSKVTSTENQQVTKRPTFTLSMGPIVASVANPAGTNAPWLPGSAQKQIRPTVSQPSAPAQSNSFEAQAPELQDHKPKVYNLGGPLQLAGGLAFLGALEVRWVVDGEEIERGQIALDEGLYNINVQGLTGHIVVSLYDKDEYLIGEGHANLEEVSQDANFDQKNIPIVVKDINVSLAGKVKSVYSIGSTTEPIEDAEVSLYGIDATATSDEDGEYHFNQWKNSDSKTLAQASKAGYRDSIFLVDSNVSQDVILVSDAYASAFFSRLKEIGHEADLEQKGMIYGTIQREEGPSAGLRAEVEGYPSVYLQSYFAMEGQTNTDDSGIFAVVGLDSGDHILRIYDGQTLIDQRILAVENGKISPVEIHLKPQSKILSFIDPLFNEPLSDVGARFFDEEYTLINTPDRVKSRLSQGSDPALLQFVLAEGQENTAFVSRNDRYQQVPVVNTKWLDTLNKKLALNNNAGVAFGFIQTDKAFRVVVAEKVPEQTIYFDKKGNLMEKPGPSMAGFILIGIDEGLHTLMIESPTGDELYFTDLVYNNHESQSVILHDL